MAVDRGFSGLHVERGARLDFDEAEHVALPSNQVDLTAAARGAEVASDHGVAQPAQMKVGGLFAAASGAMMGSGLVRRERVVCQPV